MTDTDTNDTLSQALRLKRGSKDKIKTDIETKTNIKDLNWVIRSKLCHVL